MGAKMIDKQVSFKIEARVVLQLGVTLIPDELTALLEMIKNSYDADATYVTITVNSHVETPYGKGFILIKDNGNGMTPFILEEAFMKLATSFKQHVKISPYFERKALGNKGIGRLSTQRLGKNLKVITIPDVERLALIDSYIISDLNDLNVSSNKFILKMNWGDLDTEQEISKFKGFLSAESKKSTDLPGTEILIEGLNDLSYWNVDQFKINKIKAEIFGMTNIFSSINRDLFKFDLNVNGKKITNDAIDENVLRTSADSYVYFSFNNWKLKIDIYRNIRYISRRYESFLNIQRNNKLTIIDDESTCFNNYANEFLCSSINIDLLDNEHLTTTLEQFSNRPELNVDELISERVDLNLAYPGSFNGSIFALDKSAEALTQLSDQLYSLKLYEKGIRLKKEILSIWEKAQGFYIFKNSFRILPYGKKDWAGFDTLAMYGVNNIFKSSNLSGYVSINGIDSEHLKEQTNRSGLVLDNYGNNFMTLIEKYIVKTVADDDKRFRTSLTISTKKSNEYILSSLGHFKFEKKNPQLVKKNADSSISSLISNVDVVSQYITNDQNGNIIDNDSATIVNQALKSIENAANELTNVSKEYEKVMIQEKSVLINELNQIRSIYPLAAQGIIVESLSHELSVTENHIRRISRSAIEDLNSRLYFNDQNRMITHHTTLHNQILNKLDYFSKTMDHIAPLSKSKLTTEEVFDAKEFIIIHYSKGSPMRQDMEKKGIEFDISGDSFCLKCAKGYLVTILDNLILNSIYWLDRVKVQKKTISLKLLENGTILFFDSGYGFVDDIIDLVFDPFVTTREGGRGLGLYICKEMMDLMNGRITLDRINRNEYNRIYSIILQFEVY